MKHFFLILLTTVGITFFSSAQNPNSKWGKPSQAEWSLQAWGEAPDAEAIVLYRTMDVTYQITRQFSSYSNVSTELSVDNTAFLGNNENSNVVATYENKLRIKILKDSGTRYANIDIIYLCDEEDLKIYDELERLKVAVYTQNEKGKVSRRFVKNDSFKEERVDSHYVVRHITVPDVKKGDIIEYQYTLTSSRVAFLYDCSFQEDIPVLYAKCDMDIPAFLQFNMNVPIHPFVKSKVEPSKINAVQSLGDMQAPKGYPSNHYIIEGHDILPKNLDLQRKSGDVESAKVSANSGKLLKTVASFKGRNANAIAPMPKDKNHIMIGVY